MIICKEAYFPSRSKSLSHMAGKLGPIKTSHREAMWFLGFKWFTFKSCLKTWSGQTGFDGFLAGFQFP